jgi:hypothetical protein
LRGAEVVAGVVCILGLGLSSWLLPEPKAQSLEQLEQAAYAPQSGAKLRPATS